jgi:hypothetical protein
MDSDPLEVWAVATFNVVGFGLALVLAGHTSGALSDALSGLGTLPGLLVFGYLWALVWYETRWALAEGGLERIREGELRALLSRGALAGGLIGAAFVVGVVVAGFFTALLGGDFQLVAFLLVGLIGGLVAALVGAVVGVLFVLVDAALFGVASVIAPPPFAGDS